MRSWNSVRQGGGSRVGGMRQGGGSGAGTCSSVQMSGNRTVQLHPHTAQ